MTADLGYTATRLWNGPLSDTTLITKVYLKQMAVLLPADPTIVMGHLNHVPVTHVYDALVDVIRTRGLQTVPLDDVFTIAPDPRVRRG